MEPSAKERRYQLRKREIIDAAASVFAEKGYHGASTTDIAAVLGIRQGSLYHYVSSKEEALEQVCWVGVDGYVNGALEILDSDQNNANKITAAVANHLLPMKDRQNYVIVFNNERHHLPKRKRQRIWRSSRQYEAAIEAIFAEGIAHGDLVANLDPRLATLSLIGLCNSAIPWLRQPTSYSVEAVIQAYSEILLNGMINR